MRHNTLKIAFLGLRGFYYAEECAEGYKIRIADTDIYMENIIPKIKFLELLQNKKIRIFKENENFIAHYIQDDGWNPVFIERNDDIA